MPTDDEQIKMLREMYAEQGAEIEAMTEKVNDMSRRLTALESRPSFSDLAERAGPLPTTGLASSAHACTVDESGGEGLRLPPCPFCGHVGGYVAENAAGNHAFRCANRACEAEGPWSDKASEARAAWNRRPAPTPIDADALAREVVNEYCKIRSRNWRTSDALAVDNIRKAVKSALAAVAGEQAARLSPGVALAAHLPIDEDADRAIGRAVTEATAGRTTRPIGNSPKIPDSSPAPVAGEWRAEGMSVVDARGLFLGGCVSTLSAMRIAETHNAALRAQAAPSSGEVTIRDCEPGEEPTVIRLPGGMWQAFHRFVGAMAFTSSVAQRSREDAIASVTGLGSHITPIRLVVPPESAQAAPVDAEALIKLLAKSFGPAIFGMDREEFSDRVRHALAALQPPPPPPRERGGE